MKSKFSFVIQYIIIFFGFLSMYFFTIPGSDNFYFSRDYDNTLQSILWNALHYGNGRLIGNIVGFSVVQNFILGGAVVAITMTLLIFFVNGFFFKGKAGTLMPIALVVAFPNLRFISDVYSSIPTFSNFVLPVMLFFCALCLVKNGEKSGKPILCGIPTFVFAALSCLCSENTTISIFTAAGLYAIHQYLSEKKISLVRIILAAGTAAGGLAMLLIPKITKTDDVLDSYRGIASSIVSIIKQCLVNYFTFTDIFSSFALLTAIISAALIIQLVRSDKFPNKTFKTVLISCLAASPVEFVIYTVYSKNAPYSIYMYIIQSGFVTLYALALFAGILCLKKSEIKTVSLGFYILTLSSIGPMMIVNICGYRTFYHTFIIVLSFALYLIIKTLPDFKSLIPELPKETIKKACAATLSVVFIGISANIFVQSVYNYNYYIARTNHLAEAINNREPIVEVPPVPCTAISNDDEFPSLLACLLYKYEGYTCDIQVVTFGSEKPTNEFYEILEKNPVSNIINAFNNLDYKNIEIIDKLTNVNSSVNKR